MSKGRVPVGPHWPRLGVLAGHEEGKIIQPGSLLTTKGFELVPFGARRLGQKSLRRTAQQAHLEVNNRGIIHTFVAKARRLAQFPGIQDALLLQALQVKQQRITGKSGKALVGRIGVARGVEGQHLPKLLPGAGQEIGKIISGGSQVADAVSTRQGGNVQQDATTASKLHRSTLSRKTAAEQGECSPGEGSPEVAPADKFNRPRGGSRQHDKAKRGVMANGNSVPEYLCH